MKRHSTIRERNVREAKRLYGTRCFNCGSDKEIQFHHAVSLSCGGNDVATNMIPLCRECHAKVHGVIGNLIKKNGGGRPNKNMSDVQITVLEKILLSEAPTVFAKVFLGAKKVDKKDTYTKEAMQRLGIEDYRNNICVMLSTRGVVHEGEICGWVRPIRGKRGRVVFSPQEWRIEEVNRFLNDNGVEGIKERRYG